MFKKSTLTFLLFSFSLTASEQEQLIQNNNRTERLSSTSSIKSLEYPTKTHDYVDWQEEPDTPEMTMSKRCKATLGVFFALSGITEITLGLLNCFGNFPISSQTGSCDIVTNFALTGCGAITVSTGLYCIKGYWPKDKKTDHKPELL